MKNVLVTGYSGVSEGFVEAYGNKYNVFTPEPETEYSDYMQINEFFSQEKFDAVVHFTAPYKGADTLSAFQKLQYAATVAGVSKIILVSQALDTDLLQAVGLTEEAFEKNMPYSAKSADRYLMHLLASKDKITTVLRVGSVYGRGSVAQSEEANIFSAAVTSKKSISIQNEKTYSAIYCEDLYKIISMFIENSYPKGVYNVANPTPVTYGEFAKKTKQYAHKAGKELTVTVGEGIGEFTMSVNKLVNTLGVFKFTSITTGVNKAIEYYKSHRQLLKREKEDK